MADQPADAPEAAPEAAAPEAVERGSPVPSSSAPKTDGSPSGSSEGTADTVSTDEAFEPPSSPTPVGFYDKKPTVAQIRREREALFTDLKLDRQRSARSFIEEAFQEEMLKIGTGQPLDSELPPAVPVRFRHAPAAPPAHDLFGDAVQTLFQKLMARKVSAEYCHWMAYWIAKEIDEQFPVKYRTIPFNSMLYETEGTEEARKKFADEMWTAACKVAWKSVKNSHILRDKWTGIHVSAFSMKGHRAKQEDRFVCYPNGLYMNRGQDPLALLAVFDGHGGHECAHYAAAHIADTWMDSRHQNEIQDPPILEKLLVRSLMELDARMSLRVAKEQWKGGCTAVACSVDMERKNLAMAWVGDSPGYIMNNLEVKKVTKDHSPLDPGEARRVEECGGCLLMVNGELRVNGVLNLTRALGDIHGKPMISNCPDYYTKEIEPQDYLVLLTCDGVSDVFNTSDLYNVIQGYVNQFPVDQYSELARYICTHAINNGSSDNVTVVIGFIRPPEDLWRALTVNSDDESDEQEESEHMSDED